MLQVIKKEKRPFTLLEMMIGLAIASLALGLIFSSLYQETTLKKKIEGIEKEVMQQVEVQQRLDQIFANLKVPTLQSEAKSLYSTGGAKPKLFFIFDNGIDPEPLLCGAIDGVLCVEENSFVLKLREQEECAQVIVLKKNINTIAFEFLAYGVSGLKSFENWGEMGSQLPCYVKITLDGKEEYACWINQEEEGIPIGGGL